jgi:hypothetical protein
LVVGDLFYPRIQFNSLCGQFVHQSHDVNL